MTGADGEQSDHDKQCCSLHGSTPVSREYAPLRDCSATSRPATGDQSGVVTRKEPFQITSEL